MNLQSSASNPFEDASSRRRSGGAAAKSRPVESSDSTSMRRASENAEDTADGDGERGVPSSASTARGPHGPGYRICHNGACREIVQKDELLTSHGVARRGAQRVDPGELLVQRAWCDFYPRRSLAQDVRRQREGRRRPRNPHAYSLVWEKDRRRTAVPPCPLAFRWPARAC